MGVKEFESITLRHAQGREVFNVHWCVIYGRRNTYSFMLTTCKPYLSVHHDTIHAEGGEMLNDENRFPCVCMMWKLCHAACKKHFELLSSLPVYLSFALMRIICSNARTSYASSLQNVSNFISSLNACPLQFEHGFTCIGIYSNVTHQEDVQVAQNEHRLLDIIAMPI